MAEKFMEISPQMVREIFWPPVWDPVPPWLELNKDKLRQFAELEIQFKVRELQIQQEKLEQFKKIIM